ncbi:MAG: hypothetical protein COB65_12300 [Thalassobium sp.]|nr:MAG: hypothetical protein COB65_12300 [Thalassobium sp.]|tara:strand:- start:45 stop:320 length:276 start_codon:yes stop_codon:yes gene_type:complete
MKFFMCVLFGNALLAFAVAFYLQAVLLLRVMRASNNGMGIGDSNSVQANLMRFINGEIWPDLRWKWSRAVLWLACSVALLFALGFAFQDSN